MAAKKKAAAKKAPELISPGGSVQLPVWDGAKEEPEKIIQFSNDRGQLTVLTNQGRIMQHIRGGMWKTLQGPKL